MTIEDVLSLVEYHIGIRRHEINGTIIFLSVFPGCRIFRFTYNCLFLAENFLDPLDTLQFLYLNNQWICTGIGRESGFKNDN